MAPCYCLLFSDRSTAKVTDHNNNNNNNNNNTALVNVCYSLTEPLAPSSRVTHHWILRHAPQPKI